MNGRDHDGTTVTTMTARVETEIDQLLTQLRQAALASGGLCCVHIPLPSGATQVIATTLVAHPSAGLAGNLFGGVSVAPLVSHANVARVADLTVEQIAGAVEAALDGYHSWSVLSDNALTRMLNLDRFRQPKDNPLFADGLALRRAIDAAMNAIAVSLHKRHARLVHYFRMRYVEGATQQDIAGTMDRSERTATRIKNQLVERVAHELLRQQPHRDVPHAH